jgi:cytochrome c peroxidase
MRYVLLLYSIMTQLFVVVQAADIQQANVITADSKTQSAPKTSKANKILGLPVAPIPTNNPQSQAKIELGDKLFHDKRFSIDGTVSCSKCHDENKAFSDSLPVSVGNKGQTGTRNAPTVLNAAFNKLQFWDGREPDLESQAKQPLINPIEHGLSNYDPLLAIVRTDPYYQKAFTSVFGIVPAKVTIDHVAKAIASFERTLVSGNSPFDRFYFQNQADALSAQQKRGFELFIGQGRCVSCHTIEQDHALFTDGQFHNIGIGINQIQQDVPKLAQAFLASKNKGINVDVAVLSDKKSSELGRFAVTDELTQIGAFKTPTLRDVALTAPYMHDGSLKTLKDVVSHYNNGGVTKANDRANDFLDGGIRPLNLTDAQMEDLVAFMQALTGSKNADSTAAQAAKGN